MSSAFRGGSWDNTIKVLHSASRYELGRGWCSNRIGFRLIQEDTEGSLWVLRGGGWHAAAKWCRSVDRVAGAPDYRFNGLGFRLVQKVGDE